MQKDATTGAGSLVSHTVSGVGSVRTEYGIMRRFIEDAKYTAIEF